MSVKLGVNIDHIATLRQARKGADPDPVSAAKTSLEAGADMIVTHLRLDRRHIQEEDLLRLRRQIKAPLHLEMSAAQEMLRIAAKVRPDSVCLVPERPGEITTQGGLNLKSDNLKSLESLVKKLKKSGIGVSLFIDPDALSVRLAKNLEADCVELCTSSYANAQGQHKQLQELEKLQLAGYLARELKLALHAGHALDYHNVAPVARIPEMEALNIGFSIVSHAVFVGLEKAVREMKRLIASGQKQELPLETPARTR